MSIIDVSGDIIIVVCFPSVLSNQWSRYIFHTVVKVLMQRCKSNLLQLKVMRLNLSLKR